MGLLLHRSVVIVLLVMIVAAYLFPVNIVVGRSMLPTLKPDDILITSRLDEPERGDVVVGYLYQNGERISVVKRVIGVGGDTVVVTKDSVIVNGKVVVEDYTYDRTMAQILDRVEVPEGSLFVLGDNRNESCDSRALGCMTLKECIGVVERIIHTVR